MKPAQPWDDKYRIADWFYGTEPNDFLRASAGVIAAAGEVLSLGEGEGRNAVFLAERGCAVTALDQSAVGLEKAQRLAAVRGVRLATIQADLGDYRIEPARWDAIVSIWCHLPRAQRVLVHADAVRGLKPGGVLILEAYTPAQIGRGTGGPSSAELMPTLRDLEQELAGLEILQGRELERTVQEGSGHRGLSAVVQFIGRRPQGAPV